MYKILKKFGLVALLALLTLGTASAGVLDTFDYDASLSVDGVGDVDTVSLFGVTDTSPAGDVTYTLTMLSDTNGSASGTILSDVVSTDGILYYSEGTGTDGELVLNYFDADAVAPIDITDAGSATTFYFDVLAADLGFNLDLVVKTLTGDSTATLTLTSAVASLTRVYLPFAAFVGTGDFTQVYAIDATINSPAASDLQLAEVGTIPEPTTLALLGLGLLGFAASRKKQA